MAAAKDGCGLETDPGNGRRLHLGIPEAVFVVRDPVSRRFDLILKISFLSLPRPGLLGGTELKGPRGNGRPVVSTCISAFQAPRGMASHNGNPSRVQKREPGGGLESRSRIQGGLGRGVLSYCPLFLEGGKKTNNNNKKPNNKNNHLL